MSPSPTRSPAQRPGTGSQLRRRDHGHARRGFSGDCLCPVAEQSLATSKLPLDQGVATALGNANDFDLLNTNISTYIAQHGGSFFTGVAAAEQSAVTQRLAAWQRVARVASDFPTAQALISAGYTSAYRIASTPRASFLLTMGGPLGSSAAADAVSAAPSRSAAPRCRSS